MSAVTIRPAELRDAELLARFNEALAFESEQRRLDPQRIAAGVQAVLSDAEKGRYLVAEAAEAAASAESGLGEVAVVGQLLLTREWSDWRNAWFWWIQSVYVVPAWRRHGVYRALQQRVLADAQAAGDVCGLRLYVDRDNAGARRTYVTLGFDEPHYVLMERDL